jgi:mRNA-degrading endonuclease RelE of RelBE toxin-antitoxin system
MNGLDLLEKYPLAANVVKDWFMRSMLESFKDENVPEEFKQFMLEQGIEDDKVGKLIDVNVRILFDVFDENDIIIIIKYHDNFGFTWAVEEADEQSFYKTRKEAEHFAVEAAFDILETKLTPAVKEIEVAGEEIVEE